MYTSVEHVLETNGAVMVHGELRVAQEGFLE